MPSDATVVVIIGPTKPFLPEEIAALQRYFDARRAHVHRARSRGGRQQELLGPLGLKYIPTVLANDVGVRAQDATSSATGSNIVTASFSSHPSVTTLGRYGGRAPLILIGAGALRGRQGDKPKDERHSTRRCTRTPPTWNDLNGNFTFDAPAETRKAWELAMAVREEGQGQGQEGRRARIARRPTATSSPTA